MIESSSNVRWHDLPPEIWVTIFEYVSDTYKWTLHNISHGIRDQVYCALGSYLKRFTVQAKFNEEQHENGWVNEEPLGSDHFTQEDKYRAHFLFLSHVTPLGSIGPCSLSSKLPAKLRTWQQRWEQDWSKPYLPHPLSLEHTPDGDQEPRWVKFDISMEPKYTITIGNKAHAYLKDTELPGLRAEDMKKLEISFDWKAMMDNIFREEAFVDLYNPECIFWVFNFRNAACMLRMKD